ncbi:hypothetical protein OBE_04555, partial [human gut metagenome]
MIVQLWFGKAINHTSTTTRNLEVVLMQRQQQACFDYLKEKNQIVYYGFIDIDDMKPGDLIFYGDY